MKGKLLALLVVVSPAAAFAGPVEEAQLCSAIPDSLVRLTCFDKVFPKDASSAQADGSPSEETPSPATRWEVRTEKSPIDDSPQVVAALVPIDSSGTNFGRKPTLIMRCSENVTSVYFVHGAMMIDDSVRVTTRIGDAKAQTSSWNPSTDYSAVGLWSGGTAIPFIKQLAGKARLVIRAEARNRVDAEFDLGNIDEVIPQIASACRWPA